MVRPFPEDIIRFLYDHIDSIDRLEILRILGEDREKEWDSVALAGAVQADPQVVRAHLMAMHSRGLLMVMLRGADLACRYGARTPELEDMVNRLLRTYTERPVTTINLVYERARNPLRALADALRIKKSD
jgi:hypothetical protein